MVLDLYGSLNDVWMGLLSMFRVAIWAKDEDFKKMVKGSGGVTGVEKLQGLAFMGKEIKRVKKKKKRIYAALDKLGLKKPGD